MGVQFKGVSPVKSGKINIRAVSNDFNNVMFLSGWDGANGAKPVKDDSLIPHTMTYVGTAAASTTASKFGGSSLRVGTGNYVSVPDSSRFNAPAGRAFTMEFWANHDTAATQAGYLDHWDTAGGTGFYMGLAAGVLYFQASATAISSAWTPTAGAWHHIAVDRDASGGIRLFVDGVVKASATGHSYAITDNTKPLTIGLWDTNRPLIGYMDEVRITIGANRYPAAFTPHTTILPRS